MTLIRLGRRHTAPEAETDNEFAKLVFPAKGGGLDLNPSLYETNGTQQQLVQAHAEHTASSCDVPSKGALHFDVTGMASQTPVATVGKTRFSFTKSAHRELRFSNYGDLVAFAGVLRHSLLRRARETTLAEVRNHVQQELAKGSVEWTSFRNDPTTKSSWKRLMG